MQSRQEHDRSFTDDKTWIRVHHRNTRNEAIPKTQIDTNPPSSIQYHAKPLCRVRMTLALQHERARC